jgi:hypothetical protein
VLRKRLIDKTARVQVELEAGPCGDVDEAEQKEEHVRGVVQTVLEQCAPEPTKYAELSRRRVRLDDRKYEPGESLHRIKRGRLIEPYDLRIEMLFSEKRLRYGVYCKESTCEDQ